jgi:5-methylthioadenosine/S-adenosylhomocysteine deaminase
VGKKADITIVDRGSLRMTPVHTGKYDNTMTSLVYSASADDVDTVIIDGAIVLEGGRLTMVSEEEIVERATETGRDLLARREPFVEARDRHLDEVF